MKETDSYLAVSGRNTDQKMKRKALVQTLIHRAFAQEQLLKYI